jgi:hypothetical protein
MSAHVGRSRCLFKARVEHLLNSLRLLTAHPGHELMIHLE